jgi:hypothetical protein
MLGAFAFLSRVKGKTDFETYIPLAVQRLRNNLGRIPSAVLPRLKAIAERLALQRDMTMKGGSVWSVSK